MVLLFLDIDGVLRPMSAPPGRFHPPCLQRFQAVVRDFPALAIVISSDWRWRAPREMLLSLFDEDIRPRIVGVTPFLPGEYDGSRYREILAFLDDYGDSDRERSNIAVPDTPTGNRGRPDWIAFDDTACLFPEGVVGVNVLLTDPQRAFDEDFEGKVRERLRVMMRSTP